MTRRDSTAIQDFYRDDFAHCYGCGRLNDHGLHVQTRWDGDETVARFTPEPWHIAMPGYVYGGLIASLIDCHAIGTAAAATERAAGRDIGAGPAPRFVTASLRIDFLRPTPIGPELEIRGRIKEITGKKVIVETTLSAAGATTAQGTVVAVAMPASMMKPMTPVEG